MIAIRELDEARGIVDGDAATYLEALVFDDTLAERVEAAPAGAIAVELVGQHLRMSGSMQIGFHRRLSDFINNHDGLIRLLGATILRRNGDPTRVTAPSIWISPSEVTLIGQATVEEEHEAPTEWHEEKRQYQLIVVTTGHTLTGAVHLNAAAQLDAFIESSSPPWIPLTDVRTRSLADRRVLTHYDFALLNRRHIAAATELQAGMVRGRGAI